MFICAWKYRQNMKNSNLRANEQFKNKKQWKYKYEIKQKINKREYHLLLPHTLVSPCGSRKKAEVIVNTRVVRYASSTLLIIVYLCGQVLLLEET
jgi:hypothetical protein